jgi:hypothetical protein
MMGGFVNNALDRMWKEASGDNILVPDWRN